MGTNSGILTRARLLGGGLLALGLMVSACGASYDRAEFIAELSEDPNIDQPTATCIADGMEKELGVDRLDDRGSLTTEEEETVTQLTVDCFLGE